MICRIELVNFMSHRQTVIEPAAGLTVLVGPNNCGKSAVVSALQILCENVRGDYMVRHAEDECRIVVETDDGHTIEWRRVKGVQSYCLDGEEVHRLQGGIPENLHDLLRLPKVRSSDEGYEFDIHFGEQKEPIFLVNQPGSRAATFFASSSDASRLVEMQQLHRNKGQQARRDEKRLVSEVEELASQLEHLEPALALEKQAQQAERDRQAIVRLTDRLSAQRQVQESIREHLRTLQALEAETATLKPLAAPPELVDSTGIEQLICQIRDVEKWRAREINLAAATEHLASPPELRPVRPLEELIERLAGLESQQVAEAAICRAATLLAPPPALAETTPLATMIKQSKEAAHAAERAQLPVGALASIPEPPELTDTDSIEALLEQLQEAHDRMRGVELAGDLLSGLTEPPTPADESALADTVDRLAELAAETANLKKQSKRAARELMKSEQALRDWASESYVCPTCGAELDPDRVVEMAGSGLGGHNHG